MFFSSYPWFGYCFFFIMWAYPSFDVWHLQSPHFCYSSRQWQTQKTLFRDCISVIWPSMGMQNMRDALVLVFVFLYTSTYVVIPIEVFVPTPSKSILCSIQCRLQYAVLISNPYPLNKQNTSSACMASEVYGSSHFLCLSHHGDIDTITVLVVLRFHLSVRSFICPYWRHHISSFQGSLLWK